MKGVWKVGHITRVERQELQTIVDSETSRKKKLNNCLDLNDILALKGVNFEVIRI